MENVVHVGSARSSALNSGRERRAAASSSIYISGGKRAHKTIVIHDLSALALKSPGKPLFHRQVGHAIPCLRFPETCGCCRISQQSERCQRRKGRDSSQYIWAC